MRVIITGGGTGGHIYPALALADSIKKNDKKNQILYVGANRGIETTIVPEYGLDFVGLDLQGISRKKLLSNFKTLSMLQKSIKKSKQIIDDFKPDVVVGFGGYASSAMLIAAQSKKIPTVIHEQNSMPGLTNTWLSKKANKVAVSFESTIEQFPKNKTVLTGNPRAQKVVENKRKAKLSEYGLKNNKKTILIFGGSQGALNINKAFIGAAQRISSEKDIQILFVTGPKYYESTLLKLGELGIKESGNIKSIPYIENMDDILRNIDLIVARSGATTLAEITAMGVPSILIPSPNVTANQQEINARDLEEKGATKVIVESELTSEMLFHDLKKIIEDKKILSSMSRKAVKLGYPKAADSLFATLIQVTNGKN